MIPVLCAHQSRALSIMSMWQASKWEQGGYTPAILCHTRTHRRRRRRLWPGRRCLAGTPGLPSTMTPHHCYPPAESGTPPWLHGASACQHTDYYLLVCYSTASKFQVPVLSWSPAWAQSLKLYTSLITLWNFVSLGWEAATETSLLHQRSSNTMRVFCHVQVDAD